MLTQNLSPVPGAAPTAVPSPVNPMAILAKILPVAKNVDQAAQLAAHLAPPPPAGFKPPPPMPVGQLQALPQPAAAPTPGMQLAPLLRPQMIAPPMTQGVARTTPQIGEHLLGGQGY